MANTLTTNPAITSRYLANSACQTLGRADLVTIVGGTAISAPTLITDGYAFYGLSVADVQIVVTGGTVTANLWAGFISAADGAIRWTLAAGASTQTVTANGGWLTPCGNPDRIAVQIVNASGAPATSIAIGAAVSL